jgi:hypothetical protein
VRPHGFATAAANSSSIEVTSPAVWPVRLTIHSVEHFSNSFLFARFRRMLIFLL